MSLNSSEVISPREVCGSTPAEGAQPAEGTLPRKATKPLAPQALKSAALARCLLLPLLGYQAEFVVPLLAETADKRFLQKLIDRQMQFLA